MYPKDKVEDSKKTWIHTIQMLYEGSECAVLDEGEESEWFKVKSRVK